MSKYFHTQVKELGKPAMSLFEPDVATKKATFGMSWFWFPEAQFGCAKGVIRTRVGYAGGSKKNPTYYSLGDHTETIGKKNQTIILLARHYFELFFAKLVFYFFFPPIQMLIMILMSPIMQKCWICFGIITIPQSNAKGNTCQQFSIMTKNKKI